MNDIEKAVREELGKIIKVDIMNISGDDIISEVAELDSLSILELFGMLEERFKVTLPPEKVAEMKTINDIVKIFFIISFLNNDIAVQNTFNSRGICLISINMHSRRKILIYPYCYIIKS